LTIGGAYSVDKHYRLMRAGLTEEENDPKVTGWFSDEQLTHYEQKDIDFSTYGKHYDFVFTHTCPISWEPRDLFLDFVDQSSVDKSTELWLDKVKDHISWNVWCFGHYHADRIERPFVEQFYYRWATLDKLWSYWNGEVAGERAVPRSPLYYAN
jgi:3-oxoacid CoA-transferase subunit A